MSKKDKFMQHGGASGGAFYCLGGIGALVYFLQQADGFTQVIVAILKSIVWPGFFVYELMKFLEM